MKTIKESSTLKTIENGDVISYMENKYPEMTKEFRTIQKEQYELFLRKQHDYGPQNVAVGSLLKTKEDMDKYLEQNNLVEGKGCRVVLRKGEDTRCEHYCNVNQFCDYYMDSKATIF